MRTTALFIAGLFSLTSCGVVPTPLGGDQLNLGGDEAIECMPREPAGVLTVDSSTVENKTDADFVLKTLTVLGGRGVTVGRAGLLPIRNMTLVGTRPRWPPTGVDPGLWSELRPFPAKLTKEDGRMNLVFELKYDEVPSGFERVRVTYEAGGESQIDEGSVELQVREKCTEPS